MQLPPPELPDFVAFWQTARAAVERIPTAADLVPEGIRAGRRWSHIRWTQPNGIRIGGWLLEPLTAPTCGIVVGHGYGGRDNADSHLLPPGAVGIFPCMPGFHRSAQPGIPDDAARHVVHGIANRDTYLIRDCVEATWRAFEVLAQRFPGLRLGYQGTSFGGGVGALALPWEHRCLAAALEVPTFGNHPLRLRTPCTGSGEAVRLYHRQHPEVAEVLAYYDAAIAAKHIRCPTLVAPAEFDPAVPARGQWSVAEALPGAVIHRLSAGHPTPDGEAAEWQQAMLAFLSKHLAGRQSAGSGAELT
jgi:cephalosporin-C deacetylase